MSEKRDKKGRIGLELFLALRAKKSGKIRRNRSRNNEKIKLKRGEDD